MTKLEIARKCRESAQWVRDHGFIKHSRNNGGWGRCALGIMGQVMGDATGMALTSIESFAPDFTLAVARPLPAISMDPDRPALNAGWTIASWNNKLERKAEDLIEHFDAVALSLEIEALADEKDIEPVVEKELVVA